MLAGALLLAAAPVPDPVAASFVGMFTAIEDDDAPAGNGPVRGVATTGCMTRITGERHAWSIDWSRATAVALEDTFVFVDAAPVRIAIVADVGRPGVAAKLREMQAAMVALATRCRGGRAPAAPDEADVRLP